MYTASRSARALGFLALTALFATPALAQKITSSAVTDITLTGLPSSVDVNLKDMSNGTSLAGVNVQPTTTSLTFPVSSIVKCAKNQWGYSHSLVGFGAFNPTFLDAGVVHQQPNPNAGHTTWTGTQWITEAPATLQYQVALNALKNPAKPSYQLDVMAEFNAAMNTFIQQGGTKLEYLKSNRTINIQRSVSVLGACWTGASTKGFGSNTQAVTIRLKYQGNPKLMALNAQLGQMGGGGIQVGDQVMNISSGQIQPYAPNYVGTCPVDLKFRVQLNGVGNGSLRYRINENSSTVYESATLPFTDGKLQSDFIIPVKYDGPLSLNKKVAHSYTLHVRYKDEQAAVWPISYQPFGGAAWSLTCIPKVNVGTGGAGQGGVQLAPNNGTPPGPAKLNIQAQPSTPRPLQRQVAPAGN